MHGDLRQEFHRRLKRLALGIVAEETSLWSSEHILRQDRDMLDYGVAPHPALPCDGEGFG